MEEEKLTLTIILPTNTCDKGKTILIDYGSAEYWRSNKDNLISDIKDLLYSYLGLEL